MTQEIWQAPISGGKNHAIVVAVNQDIRPQLPSCSDFCCSFLGMDLKIHLLQEEIHSWWKDKLVGFSFLLTCAMFPCSGGWNLKAEAQVTLWAGESGKCVHSSNCNQMFHLHVDVPHPHAVPPRAPFTASSKGSWCFPMQK